MGKRKIGVWAGSSPTKSKPWQQGLKALKGLGVEPTIPQAVRKYAGKKESNVRAYLAGPDKAKVQGFLELWHRTDLREILCVRGGYGTLRLLPYLDKASLKTKTPKIVWGYSDLTVLQNYLYFREGLPWVHSPMLTGPTFFEPRGIEKAFWKKILNSTPEVSELKLKRLHGPKKLKLTASMIGGNLTCFVSMLGTKWEPDPKNDYFLFLEDVSEADYRIDRLLHQLSGSKILKNCKAVLLGHFTDCPKAEKIIQLWAKEQNLPLFGGIKAGHDRPNLPLPMGTPVRLETKKRGETILTVPNPSWGC